MISSDITNQNETGKLMQVSITFVTQTRMLSNLADSVQSTFSHTCLIPLMPNQGPPGSQTAQPCLSYWF